MAFQPFQNTLTTLRIVQIPSELTHEKHAALVRQIRDAVAKQAALAESCDAILRPVGEVREQEGILLIEHEPAIPFDLNTILSADERPDVSTLWWVTWSALRALAASEAKRTIHGGIQLRSFFIDRIGRVKLTDFGLASAIEVVCGRESRRHLVCDGASDQAIAERGLSGSWAKLDESAQRENAWIATRFAPEILAGGMRLNLTADQFSLGVALYELATGVHPLGAELSNPELFGYFVPEPYALEDERADWADAFERQSSESAVSGDQPVLKWGALVYRLLANEPGERFANFTDALEAAREHVPVEWVEALRVLGESLELLVHEQYDPFLTSLGPWSENTALPELWRARLAQCITEVEQLKATEAARKAIEARLNDGYAALDREQLEEARAIAAEVGDSLGEEDAFRERVTELERLCDEHERHIQEKADELTRANLDSAREAFERGEFPEARMIVTAVLEDPLTSSAFAQQAEQLLMDIDKQAKRVAQQRDEFETAKAEFGEGKLSAALQRLELLLVDVNLVDSLRGTIETFSKEVEVERQRLEEQLEIIRQVEAALGRGDLAAAEETLAVLPFDTQDPQIVNRREELVEACERLRKLLERRDAVEERLRRGEAEHALRATRELLEEDLSPALREQLNELAEGCQQVIDQIQKAQVSDALESLALAETAYQAGDVQKCQRLLSVVLPLADRLDDPDRQRAIELDSAAIRLENAIRRIQAGERRSAQHDFDPALAELDAIATEDLPGATLERISALRAEIEQAREDYRQQRARELTEWLEQVAEHLARSEVNEAQALLSKSKMPADAGPRLTKRFEQLREDTIRGRKVLESLAAVEGALRSRDHVGAGHKLDQLGAAVTPLPGWAAERIELLRGRITELEQAWRAQAVEQAQAALDAAAAALEAGDHAPAAKHLAAAQAAVDLSAELRPRYEELERAAADLEAWLPKLASVETALEREQLAEAYQDTATLLKQIPIPTPVEKRLRAVETQSREKIVAHHAAVTTRLRALESELEQRGRRVKSFARRIEAIKKDALATQEHQDAAAELARRFEALPRPRGFPVPIAIAAAVVVVAGGVGWYLMRGEPAPGGNEGPEVVTPEPPPPAPDPTPTPDQVDAQEQIAAALKRIRSSYAQAVAELPADQSRPDWELYFEPEDAFETALFARDGSGRVLELAGDVPADGLETLELTARSREQLFPAPEPVEPVPDEVEGSDEPVVEVTPTEPEWPTELAPGTLTELSVDRLSTLLGSIAPPEALVRANPPLSVLAEILEQVEVGERSGENRVTIRMVLKDEAGSTEAQFALELETDRWQPAAENGGKLRGLLTGLLTGVQGHVSAVADDIQHYYLNGKLVEAYRAYEQAQALASAFAMRELAQPVARLEAAQRRLPLLWRNPGGYEESAARDEDLDYPRVLTRDGRALLLVNVLPNDQLWNEIRAADQARAAAREAVGYALSQEAQKSPDERRWHIFYIEAAEPSERVEDGARAFARQQTGRDLPTTDQWLLAALKLRGRSDASGFFGGLWEWCLKDARPWVCGGCDALHARYLPWPDEQAKLAQVWAWLNNALVSQPRLRGDSLAGVRTVVQPG